MLINLLRSDDTDARYRQGAQGTDTEHLRAGSRQTAKDHGRQAGMSLLARSKRGGDRVAPGGGTATDLD